MSYWDDFYKNNPKHILTPSDFCRFVVDNYNLSSKEVVDVCCGNGRDTYALSLAAKHTTGVDFASKPEDKEWTTFVQSDINDYLSGKSDLTIYSRFGIHAFDETTEDNVIDRSKELYLEFRSDKDDQFVNDHYRRLINGNSFLTKLISKGFEIRYFRESQGMAVYKNFDPWVIRVVAER